MNKKILGVIILILTTVMLSAKGTVTNVTDTKIHYYTIDGFERPGEWNVHFSKFRARKWNRLDEKKDNKRDKDTEWYDWFQVGKPFTAKEILPDFIYKNQSNPKIKKEITILGIKARWDVQGYNWISILPNNNIKNPKAGDKNRYGGNKLGRYADEVISNDSLADEEYRNYDGGNYILLPGNTKDLAIYVWGSMYDYNLEFHVEDYKGKLHTLNAGSIKFKGWYRVQAVVPEYVLQLTSHLPRPKPLKFKAIKFVLNPYERISGTYIYIDYLHGKTDTYLESFFGEGLENSQRIWKRNKKSETGLEKDTKETDKESNKETDK